MQGKTHWEAVYANKSVEPGGNVIVATLGANGPLHCSRTTSRCTTRRLALTGNSSIACVANWRVKPV